MTRRLAFIVALITTATAPAQGQPVGTAFTYQGRLIASGLPANGPYDLRFLLFDAPTAGNQVGPNVDRPGTSITDGLFTVTLDFGVTAFTGSRRWLEIRVSPAGAGTFTTLSPRQELTASPNAVFSTSAPWAGVTGKPAGFADDIDNDTTYTAGGGLSLAATVFSLAPGGVATANLADGSVTSAKIADGTVALADLGQNGCGPTQVMKWNGSAWACANDADAGGDITAVNAGLGLTGGAVTGDASMAVSFGGTGAVTTVARSDHDHFTHAWTGTSAAAGLRVTNNGGGGILGVSGIPDGNGLHGRSTATTGVSWGVFGESPAPDGAGVVGFGTGTSGESLGVYGTSGSSAGVGVRGVTTSTNGLNYGVRGASASTTGAGMFGIGSATSGPNRGVVGTSSSSEGIGVLGRANALTGIVSGVRGESASTGARAVLGLASSTSGFTLGVQGHSLSNSDGASGVSGYASAGSGIVNGVLGETASADGNGVYGLASSPTGNAWGMWGLSQSTAGLAIVGQAVASTGATAGILGEATSTSGYGVIGKATATTGTTYGVVGQVSSPSGFAGRFDGRVQVNGDLAVTGTVSKAGGSFKIDHPLDPENKYLYHSFVESPDMMNVYNGNVTTDIDGYATVELPEWFEALNRDFRYQLTVIGQFAQAIVGKEIEGNRFTIRTSHPNVKVSWQVTGIRHDPFAERHRIPVEEEKPGAEQGTYLHPDAYGQPEDRSVHHQRRLPLPASGPRKTPLHSSHER